MKKYNLGLALLLMLGIALPAVAAEFGFHGDMNNRFLLYSNHTDWLNNEQAGVINDGKVDDTLGELKYRFWVDAATNNGNVKGVYAIEIGGVRYGEESRGGSYSGDGVSLETRWAYTDLQLPGVESKAQLRMGLHPFKVNPFLWAETAAGVVYNGQPANAFGYQLAWMRTVDRVKRNLSPSITDNDNLLTRFDFGISDNTKIGVFGLYSRADTVGASGPKDVDTRNWLLKKFADQADFNIWNLGVDGGIEFDSWFINWDLIYQSGDLDNFRLNDTEFSGVDLTRDYDLSAYFLHADVGFKLGKSKVTGTVWYASGDGNPNDGDLEGFLGIDLDREDSITLFEGSYTDDDIYFTERDYLLDKGFVMLKLALDHQATQKFKWGLAAMYMMTAEDITYFNAAGTQQYKNDDIGIEINGYIKYMIYENVEFALNAGYLFADDAMDAFETDLIRDGSSDEDIFASSARVRYKF